MTDEQRAIWQEKMCPFQNGVWRECRVDKCALWVEEGENSCCGLVYQARQQVANREKNRCEREEFRKRYREKWGQ